MKSALAAQFQFKFETGWKCGGAFLFDEGGGIIRSIIKATADRWGKQSAAAFK